MYIYMYAQLARPVYHVGFIDEVVKVLRCVCFHCSRLIIRKVNKNSTFKKM
jgi:DNA-directed RNA polymerase II subunit RPB1